MNYAQAYEEHKAIWDEERQRSRIDRALTGQKSPSEAEAVLLLKKTGPRRGRKRWKRTKKR